MTRTTPAHAADVLFNTAAILEAADASPHLVASYRRAARSLLAGSAKLAADGTLIAPGIGPRLRRRLGEIVRTAPREGGDGGRT